MINNDLIYNYKHFLYQVDASKDIDVSNYIISDDKSTKNKLCDKIFNLLIYDCFNNYDELDEEHKEMFHDYVSEHYPGSEEANNIDFYAEENHYDFHHLKFKSNVYVDAYMENGHVYVTNVTNLITLNEINLIILKHFIDEIYTFKDDCVNCCENHNNLMKMYIIYLLLLDLEAKSKKKELEFFIKYLICLINNYYHTDYSVYQDVHVGYDIETNINE